MYNQKTKDNSKNNAIGKSKFSLKRRDMRGNINRDTSQNKRSLAGSSLDIDSNFVERSTSKLSRYRESSTLISAGDTQTSTFFKADRAERN